MIRGTKIRIAAFLVLSAVGIVYVTANYLGFVDKVLGRGITAEAALPNSGGLFVGSEVTYRGVKIGKVSAMTPTRDGIVARLSLEEGTRLPRDSKMFVHNLSAVGEQYLDFEPASGDGPYVRNGDRLVADSDAVPVDEGDLLVELNRFVDSVDKRNLQGVVRELGDMFADTGTPLQRLLDNGQLFVSEAAAHTDETIALLESGLTVLRTQQAEGENIRSFARDLNLLTAALADSDRDLRGTLQGTPGAVKEVDRLLTDLEPTIPVLLGNAITVNQLVVTHIRGVEQLLVTFPRVISSGFTGTPKDGYGHVNLQTDYSVPPCSGEGYKPRSEWRRGDQLGDTPIFPARCLKGPPYLMRGTNGYPQEGSASPGRAYRGSYDPASGLVDGVTDAEGGPVRFADPGNLSVLGGDSWKWLLVGPVTRQGQPG